MNNAQLIEKFLTEKPQFHVWSHQNILMVSQEALKFIFDYLDTEMNTLEIGAGHTTIIFAMGGSKHICINPSEDETVMIMDYCSKLGIGKKLTFLNESSDVALTNNESIPADLDFVFIDGAHRFPFSCIDFHYTESKIKQGGILGIDDIDIPSVKILYDFLCGEDEWEQKQKFGKTAFFMKVKQTNIVNDWQGQNININSTFYRQRKLISFVKALLKL